MKDGVDLYQKLIVGHSSGVNPAYSSAEGADSMLFLEGQVPTASDLYHEPITISQNSYPTHKRSFPSFYRR